MDPVMPVTSAFRVSGPEHKLIQDLDVRVTAIEADGGGGAVDSVNAQTGVVVLDADDIDDTSTTNKFATAAQLAAVDALGTASMAATGDFATAAQGALADTAIQPTDGLTDLDSDAATKLSGIEALADVTDAANVSTAGGLIVVAYNAGWPARPSVSGPVMWVNDTNATAPTADVAGDIVLLNEA